MLDFLESKNLYLYLMLFSIAYPLTQSFEHRITYYKKWKQLVPSILIMMLIFIPWDIWFTHNGVWWFNDKYITGIKIFNLPIEEWAFFMIVPFACVFIYEVLNYFIKKDILLPIANILISIKVLLLTLLLIFTENGLYTQLTFTLALLVLTFLLIKKPNWVGRFLRMYYVSWIPFILINGALTGAFTSEAVVNYNPDAIMNIRILTIPFEDSVYNLVMLFIVIYFYERGSK